MADVAKIFRINYKSDFILTLTSDAGWMTPFCIKFWTGAPSQAYYVSWDGETYNHCSFDPSEPTKLLVQFDDHHLPIGNLKFQVAYHFTVADFPNDTEDEVINPANITTEIDGETYQVMLDFTGETAPEIQFALPAYANEAQRIDNEQQRIAAETQRIANEETRIQHEESRIAAEQTRQQNEQQRINQEQARVNEYASLKADAVAATGAANDAAALANQKAQLAADKAALAQAAADLANAKALLAADKAALAASAAQLANDKAALAQQKAEYAQTQGGYAKDQGDYAKDKGDICSADHLVAVADHGIAVDDHTQAGNDHTRAESDHGIAVDDHTQAGNDHTRAESDHGIAADDHTQAGTDHQTAAADHQTATADHTQAGNDHTRAESDHTRAESDHAAVEVYVDSLGAFDISAYHATGGVLAKYADLTAALDTNGANVPDALRKGGMSVKFVQSSDNKYIQARCMAQNFTTDVTQWQGVDDEPTAGSDNLVKSGGVANEFLEIKGGTVNNTTFNQVGAALNNGTFSDNQDFKHTDYIEFDTSKSIKVQGYDSASMMRIANFYDENKLFLGYWSSGTSPFSFDEFTIQPSAYPSGTKYVIVNTYYSNLENSHVIYSVKGIIEDLQEHLEEIEVNPVVIEDNPLTNHTEIKAKGNVLGVVPSLNEFAEINGGELTCTSFNQVGGIQTDGVNNDSQDYRHTDYIEFDTTKSIKVKGYDSPYIVRIAVFYDENKSFLGYWSSNPSGFTNNEFTIQPSEYPTGTKYVIVNTYITLVESSHVIYNIKGSLESINKHLTEVESQPVVINDNPLTGHTEIKNGDGDVLGVVPALNEFLEIAGGEYTEDSFPIVGAVINDGSLNPSMPNFHCTDFIEINPEEKIVAKGYDSSGMIKLCNFYNESRQFLGYWSSNPSNYSLEEFTILPNDIPSGTKYIRVNTYDTVLSNSYVKYTKVGSVEKLEDVVSTLIISDNQICVPSKLYAVVGTEFNLYKDAVVMGQDKGLQSPANFNVEIRCDIGNDYERMYSITPQAAHIGTHTLTINVYSGNKELIASKSCSLVVIDNLAPSSQKNYLAIGDSTLANGNVTTYLIDKFQSNKPNTFGTNTKQLPLKNQGVGGWGIVNFTERGSVYNMYSTDYKLYTIDVADTIDVKTGSVYEDSNGNRITPSLVYSNKIQFVLSGNFDTLTSPLSLVSGGGKQSIEFTSKYTQYGNPFWNPSTNELDLDYYKTNIDFSDSFDIVSIRLGINDSLFKNIHNTVDFNVTIQRLKDLVDMFIDDGSKIIIELPSCDVSDEDAWGVNEGAGKANALGKYAYQKDLFKLRAAIISIFDNEAYNSNVEVGCAGLCVDRWYGYPASGNIQAYTGKLASIFNMTEVIHNNYVHPNEDGYKQLAYALYPQFLHLINT